MKKLIEKQRLEIIEKYQIGNISLEQLALEYNVNRTTIGRIIKKYNIPKKILPRKKKYQFNEHYFDLIDSEHKAYWLGWLYSDGCNFKKTNTISLCLQSDDIKILEEFKKDLDSNYPIHYYKSKNKNHKNTVKFGFTSKYVSEQLIKLGCVPSKSLILQFPTEEQVPKHLLRHWLRGLMDGDGCINMYKKNKNSYSLIVNFVGTNSICNGIKKYINENLNLSGSIHKPKNNSVFVITIGGNKQSYKFIEYLYHDMTICLDRKYKKFNEYKKILNDIGWSFEKSNSSNQRIIVYLGMEKNISEWSKIVGLKEHIIRKRLDAGWSIEDTMTVKNRIRNKRLKYKTLYKRTRSVKEIEFAIFSNNFQNNYIYDIHFEGAYKKGNWFVNGKIVGTNVKNSSLFLSKNPVDW